MSAATRQFRYALEAGDPQGMLDALSPDAFLRSPVAGGLRFEGHEELRWLFTATTDTYRDIVVTDDFGDGPSWVLAFHARIGSQRFQETLLLGLDDAGQIDELTAGIRPLPGAAAVAAVVGARLARRHGRVRAVVFRAVIAPLVHMTRAGETLGPRLLGATVNSNEAKR